MAQLSNKFIFQATNLSDNSCLHHLSPFFGNKVWKMLFNTRHYHISLTKQTTLRGGERPVSVQGNNYPPRSAFLQVEADRLQSTPQPLSKQQ